MSSEHLEEWVPQLNQKFGLINKKIALITDNRTAHLHVENLELMELILLPLNTTSHTQPMDHDIIRAPKVKCLSLAVWKLIAALKKKEPIPNISILCAMIMLGKVWHDVLNKASINCFKTVDFLRKK